VNSPYAATVWSLLRRSLTLSLCHAVTLPLFYCCLLAAAIAAGCQVAAPSPRRPSTDLDPCAERLHDACGRLLLYSRTNGRLPETLDDLARPDSGAIAPLVCPASGKPYVYSKDGLRVPGRAGLLVLYDAQPVHSGMRWAILVEGSDKGKPLAGRVVLLPDGPLFSEPK